MLQEDVSSYPEPGVVSAAEGLAAIPDAKQPQAQVRSALGE